VIRNVPQPLIALALLTVLALYAYGPVSNRVFAADQIGYFVELNGSQSLGDGLALYDYPLSRRYEKGDETLFRPLLFAWLAVANTLFSYHHAWWNFANLAVHVLVAFFLYRLLRELHDSLLALAAAALFLVMKPLLELPAWNHLGGYMLGWMFLLIAVRAFARMTNAGGGSGGDLIVYGAAFAAAVFFHESMVAACLIAGLILVWRDWRNRRLKLIRLALCAAPLAAYGALYWTHALRVGRLGYIGRQTQASLDFGSLGKVAFSIPDILWRWSQELAVPAALHYQAAPFSRLGKTFFFSPRSSEQMASLVVSLAILGVILSAMSRRRLAVSGPVITLFAGVLITYVGIFLVGRSQAEIMGVAYYLYFFCLAAVVILYALMDFERLRGARLPALWLAMLAAAVIHLAGTREANEMIGRANDAPSRYFSQLEQFVDARKTEPGFSFALSSENAANDPPFPMREGYPDHPISVQVFRITEVVFKAYYNKERPRYIVRWNGTSLEWTRGTG
jgi:hypothetical protein